MPDQLLLRALFLILLAAAAAYLRLFQLSEFYSALVGTGVGLVLIFIEMRARRVSAQRAAGAVIGCLFGVLIAYLATGVLNQALSSSPDTASFLKVGLLLWLGYMGLAIGASKGSEISFPALSSGKAAPGSVANALKILDTSVIIDGRIADIAETFFLEGTLIIPQFVLRELQTVADSADSLKRNRGRRGLDILQKIQKMPQLHVEIVEQDFPNVKEVDLKLIELAKLIQAKIVTNDFNLNKVAQLHGVIVLNINELANALKPVVLPGEFMRVFILKEGKEYSQGVAYLDDGTMVVVDNARKMISKTIEISVTSVLQTTAGKMIFGKFDDRMHAVIEKPVLDKSPALERVLEKPREQASAAGGHSSL